MSSLPRSSGRWPVVLIPHSTISKMPLSYNERFLVATLVQDWVFEENLILCHENIRYQDRVSRLRRNNAVLADTLAERNRAIAALEERLDNIENYAIDLSLRATTFATILDRMPREFPETREYLRNVRRRLDVDDASSSSSSGDTEVIDLTSESD